MSNLDNTPEKKQCCGKCTGNKNSDGKDSHNGHVERRTFIKVVLGGVGLLWAGLTTFPIFRYLTSGVVEDASANVSSVLVGKVDSIAVNSGKNFQFGSKPALLIRDPQGEFKAYDATCTHLGCTVQYQTGENKIFCACHGGQYDAETGKNIAGPPPKPLNTFKVHVENGNVVVSKA